MRFYTKTHTGRRQNNEDSLFAPACADGFFAVVADGMGGHNAGEVASRIVVDTIVKTLEGTDPEMITDNNVRNILADANVSVYQNASENPGRIGMGSTATVAVFSCRQVIIGQIGDSRAYLFRAGTLKQITKDHSYVQLLVDNGYISNEEARHHPQKNIITRAIGTEAAVEPDVYAISFKDGDMLLLCTDGLNNVVTDDEIAAIISRDIETAAERLVDAALQAGGTDNISVIIACKGGDGA